MAKRVLIPKYTKSLKTFIYLRLLATQKKAARVPLAPLKLIRRLSARGNSKIFP